MNCGLWKSENKNIHLRKKKSHISWVSLHHNKTLMPISLCLGTEYGTILNSEANPNHLIYMDIIALIAVVRSLAWKLLSLH